MKRFRKKKNNKPLILISIIILTIVLYYNLTINITPKILDIVKHDLNYSNNNLIMNYIELNDIGDGKLNDAITLIKDKDDNIVALDYNMNLTYKILSEAVKKIKDSYDKSLINNISYTKENKDDGYILYYPIGLAFNNVYLNSLGPKVPVKVNYLSSIEVNLKTKVSNYGINNVLVEIYLEINILEKIIVPTSIESINNKYEILLDAKVIMGNVPSFYGNTLENNSPLFQS